jgi:hypothetical protein
LSCQCLCPEIARFGGKYFLFPAILGYTGYRLSGLKWKMEETLNEKDGLTYLWKR